MVVVQVCGCGAVQCECGGGCARQAGGHSLRRYCRSLGVDNRHILAWNCGGTGRRRLDVSISQGVWGWGDVYQSH